MTGYIGLGQGRMVMLKKPTAVAEAAGYQIQDNTHAWAEPSFIADTAPGTAPTLAWTLTRAWANTTTPDTDTDDTPPAAAATAHNTHMYCWNLSTYPSIRLHIYHGTRTLAQTRTHTDGH